MATYNKRGYRVPKPKEEKVTNEFEEVLEGESTTEEVFTTLDETANKTEEWVTKNQKPIFGVIAAIAIVTLGYFFYNKFVTEPNEAKALTSMYQAQKYFNDALNKPTVSDSLFKLGLNGGEGKLGFLGIIKEHSGTKSANLANYYAGMSYLQMGDFKNAESYLVTFQSDDAILQPLALGALGDCYAELNKVDDAIASYKKAATASKNDYTTPRFLLKAGQAAMLNNKKEEANKLFNQIKKEYSTSPEANTIDVFIAMTE